MQLSGGKRIFCGLQQDGRVLCWGDTNNGDLLDLIRRAVVGETFRQISVGDELFCGIRSNQTIKCAGHARHLSKLYYPDGQFQAVHVGKDHVCALDEQGKATCWGRDKGGRATPPAGHSFARIAAGGIHSCGLNRRGELHCWGSSATQPGPFQALELGYGSICALRSSGTVWCLGQRIGHWFGPADAVFRQISVGEWHGCGVLSTGTVQCWNEQPGASEVPAGRFTAVSAGWYDTCGLRPEGYAECWGRSSLTLPDYDTAPAPLEYLQETFAGRRFEQPVELFSYTDGATAVVERKGVITAYTAGGAAQQTILDLTAQTSLATSEYGMLGAALDPEFDQFPFLYVYYNHLLLPDPGQSGRSGAAAVTARLSRFHVVNGAAIPESELVILELSELGDFHQGGAVRFGPDGMLYLGLGDNTVSDDAQDLAALTGKIIRIDIRHASAERPYGIPDDNPFAAAPGVRPEIWAYGLRNPWRISFDGRGRLWVGDVGASHREEVSLATAGANLGWPVFEGSSCVRGGGQCAAHSDAIAPVAEYGHSLGCAITGVTAHPRAADTVVFSDLCSGRVWALTGETLTGETVPGAIPAAPGMQADAEWRIREILHTAYPILSLNTDGDGNVYLLVAGQPIYRLQWPPPSSPLLR